MWLPLLLLMRLNPVYFRFLALWSLFLALWSLFLGSCQLSLVPWSLLLPLYRQHHPSRRKRYR